MSCSTACLSSQVDITLPLSSSFIPFSTLFYKAQKRNSKRLRVFIHYTIFYFQEKFRRDSRLHNNLVTSRRSGNIYAYLKQQSLFPAFYDSSSTLLQPLGGLFGVIKRKILRETEGGWEKHHHCNISSLFVCIA